jgi:uncharacterized protein
MTANWRESVKDFIRREAQPQDKFGHQPRLYALAVRIGEGLAYDDDVVFAAAWMHDLGVFVGHRPNDPLELARWNHIPYTIEHSRTLLAGWGFPIAKLDKVAAAIATHQTHSTPIEIEAVLLRDADILEQLGAIGAIRALVKVGRDTRYPTYSSVLPQLKNAIEELPSKLNLTTSRLFAAPRVERLRSWIEQIEDESNGLLY